MNMPNSDYLNDDQYNFAMNLMLLLGLERDLIIEDAELNTPSSSCGDFSGEQMDDIYRFMKSYAEEALQNQLTVPMDPTRRVRAETMRLYLADCPHGPESGIFRRDKTPLFADSLCGYESGKFGGDRTLLIG